MKQKHLVRERFRSAVFGRDRTCRLCPPGTVCSRLEAHHITDRTLMPGGGYVAANGIALCPEHHAKAERFHESGGASWHDGMHPDDLYRLIGSSREMALEESRKLADALARQGDR